MNPSKEQMEVDDAAIVQEVRAGNVDAFRVLVDRHSRALHRVAYRMTGNERDSEDIVQETLMKAFRDLDRFEARASFATWWHRIGVNCALDLLRAREYRVSECGARDGDDRSRLDSLPARDPLPDQSVCNAEIRRRITAAFAHLSFVGKDHRKFHACRRRGTPRFDCAPRKDPRLRRATIRQLGLIIEVDPLHQLYRHETSPDIKAAIIDVLFRQGDIEGRLAIARTEKGREPGKHAIEKYSLLDSDAAPDFFMELPEK